MDDYDEENHDEIIQDVENTAIDMGTFIDIGIALGKLDDVIKIVEDSTKDKNHKDLQQHVDKPEFSVLKVENETEVLDYLDDVIQDVENNCNAPNPKIDEETNKYEIL